MLRPRFYTASSLSPGATLVLEREPSRHVAKALRMQVGASLCLFDGSGREAHGVIRAIERNAVQVQIDTLSDIDRESPLAVTIAVSISRGDRMDTIVQKATELGVAGIWPLVSERTEVRLDASRLAKKREHWERVAISACEQCGRNTIPRVEPCASYDEILTRSATADGLKLLLHPGEETNALPIHCQSLLLLIGPEGGFSAREADQATAAGFRSLLLGPRILRTETAPLAALAVAQARWGDLPG